MVSNRSTEGRRDAEIRFPTLDASLATWKLHRLEIVGITQRALRQPHDNDIDPQRPRTSADDTVPFELLATDWGSSIRGELAFFSRRTLEST